MNQTKLSHEENITSGLNGLKKERDFYRDRTQTLQARLDLLIAWYESNKGCHITSSAVALHGVTIFELVPVPCRVPGGNLSGIGGRFWP